MLSNKFLHLLLVPTVYGWSIDEGELVVPFVEIAKRATSSPSDPLTAVGTMSTVYATAVPTKATASDMGTNDFKFASPTDPAYLANYTIQDPSALPGTDDGLYKTLTDTTGSVQLIAQNDGNLYLAAAQSGSPAQPGASFHTSQNIIFGDMQSRFFHYYPDEMKAYGVSRIRVSSLAKSTPIGSQMITLVPAMSGSKKVYVAADTSGNQFYLAWCNIGGQLSKVFLAKDVGDSIKKLQSSDVKWTVTGGVVSTCAPLALAVGS